VKRIVWITAAMTCISALVSEGFSLATVLQHGASNIDALYTLSRSTALLLAVLFSLGRRSTDALLATAIAASIMQLLDAGVGYQLHSPKEIFGPLFLGILNLILFFALLRNRPSAIGDAR
jgi:hypothetical protein